MFSRILLLLFLMIPFGLLPVRGVDFPGPLPGNATMEEVGNDFTLANRVLAVTFRRADGFLWVHQIENRLTGELYEQADGGAPVYRFSTIPAGQITDWGITSAPRWVEAALDPQSPSRGRQIPGQRLEVSFSSSTAGVTLDWFAELRDGAGYVRTGVSFAGDGLSGQTFTEIELLCDLTIGPAGGQQIGNVFDRVSNQDRGGEVVTSGQMFFGVEMPFFWNDLSNNRIRGGVTTSLALDAGRRYRFDAVMGVFPTGQLRRAFLHYNDRERARSYQPFLHYNGWYDLQGGDLTAANVLNRINTIYQEMTVERGVELDSFVVDDGYDDYSAATGGFWAYDAGKFPQGFTPLSTRLEEIGSSLGIWISPGGGYGGSTERFARGREELGSTFTDWDLTIPVYRDWWSARHTGHVQNDRVNYFKWDKLGSTANGHFMQIMDTARDLRELNPDLLVNTTVGTWQSPFWLNQIDCTWRGEGDVGAQGDGVERERWNTYRDRSAWERMNEAGGIYPLNALMVHGIIMGNNWQVNNIVQSKSDIRNEVRSFFGAGYALQELYLSPPIMTEAQWDALAEGAQWAKDRAHVLVDAHFIGPNPASNEVYGFAAWQNQEGALTLRNPSASTKTYSLDIGEAFELPASAVRAYALQSPYGDQRVQSLTAVAGKSIEVELQPFEVLVFDASAEVYPFMEISAPKGPAPQTLRFDLSDSMIPAAFVRYELDCDGDGVVDATTGQMRLFTYETPGAYTARLTVYDAEGRQSSTTATVVIPETVAPREEVYLSNLDWVSDSVGYGGQTKRDLSIDGNPLTLNGTVYAKGLGTHAQSEIVYALNGGYETFRAVLGVDDEVLDTNAYGDVVFKVLGDGALLYTSPGVDPLSEPISLELDVTGVQSLQLVVEEGDNNFADHANWADARLVPLESGFAAWVSDKGLSGDPEADTDGDGLSDFAEYGLGLDPAVEDAAGTVEFSVTADGVARYRFPDAVTALNFTLETSEDLQNWRPFNGPLVSDPPHFEVSVPRGDGEPEAPLFLRLRLSE